MKQIPVWILVCALLITSGARAADAPGINLRRTVTVEVIEKTKAAVVNISTTKLVSQRINPFGMDPFFQQFDFGQSRVVPAHSLGSGFIVHPDGYVITNNHFAGKAFANGVELVHMLRGELVPVPREVVESFPHLAPMTRPFPEGQQELFD